MASPSELTFDAAVGRNIQELRKARGLSQAALAKELEDRGLPFRQQTIVKVEKGHRPLRLIEAEEIADVLDVDIRALVQVHEEPRFDRLAAVIRNSTAVRDAWTTLEEKAIALYDAQVILSEALRWYRDHAGEATDAPAEVLGDAETLLAVDALEVVRAVPAKLAARYATREADADGGVLWRNFGEEGQPHHLVIVGPDDTEEPQDEHANTLRSLEDARRQGAEATAVEVTLEVADQGWDDEPEKLRVAHDAVRLEEPPHRGPVPGRDLAPAARKVNREPGLSKRRREHDEATEAIPEDPTGMEPI